MQAGGEAGICRTCRVIIREPLLFGAKSNSFEQTDERGCHDPLGFHTIHLQKG